MLCRAGLAEGSSTHSSGGQSRNGKSRGPVESKPRGSQQGSDPTVPKEVTVATNSVLMLEISRKELNLWTRKRNQLLPGTKAGPGTQK